MWRRPKQLSEEPAVSAGELPKTSRGPRALSSIDELLRRAAWDGLSDSERAKLLGMYPSFPSPAASQVSNVSAEVRSSDLEDWVAALVAESFQREASQVVRSWLADGSPDAHLYLGGNIGQGRRSLVSALSRQAMAGRPTPPDYIYVPDPSELDQAYLLSLPTGTGKAFAKDIDLALRRITSAWSAGDGTESASDSSNSASPSDNSGKQEAPAPPLLSQVIDQAFAQVEAGAPASARSYLGSLRRAFSEPASRHADLPASYEDLPTWQVRAPAGSDPFGSSGSGAAPVVVGSLIRDKLDDLLVRANGGVLVLRAIDLIVVAGSWPSLSAALVNQSLQIKADWPAMPLSLRVALVGDGEAYGALSNAPGEFSRLFRYEVWCNRSVPWNDSSEGTYAALASGVARRHGLPAFAASGVARLIEEGSRRLDGLNRTHLTTDLLLLHDLAVEAGHEAAGHGAVEVTGEHVDAALRRRRSSYLVTATRVREAILSGQEITPTAGSAVGQVNGLGIYEFHPSEGDFAVPIRISATVSPGGDERVLDIEREAEQADADHVRGEMTVEGYLAARYGKSHPINLVARIRFEQEHGTLGGDSASGALLFALLSALAEVPIRYSYSVTGAVGQYGELQPIGGVNIKIEGFWELCRMRRARGELPEGGHGVIIPAINTRDLMLRPEVAQSIASEGWFHIWPASTVDEAMTLLTGMPAAEIHARVEKRLVDFHRIGARNRG